MTPPQTREELVNQQLFPKLKDHILKATGLHYFLDKDSDLAERVLKRLLSLRIDDCAEYLAHLEGPRGEHEMDLLIAELTIGETYFFRHTEQFEGLRDIIIPDILARNSASRRLRIWSAGCASGAEPYSVSILLKTHFREQLKDWDVRILGTDINKDFLAKARRARFDEWAFRGTSADMRQQCFERVEKQWAVTPEFKNGVVFDAHNLITDNYPPAAHDTAKFDLILCRNVVIYFSQNDFRGIVSKFENCLAEGGWLLVGHAEPNTEFFDGFCVVSMPGAILYQRNVAQPPAAPPGPVAPFFPPDVGSINWSIPSFQITPAPDAIPHTPIPETSTSAPLAQSVDFETVRSLADRGQWSEAAALCETLLSQDNHISAVQCYYALILEHLGRDAESEQALKRAVYLDRKAALPHYYLGLRHRKNREFTPAARSFDNALAQLARLSADTIFPEADGITAAELKHVIQHELEALRVCEKRLIGTK